MSNWTDITRPGYFGRKRDEIVRSLNSTWGKGNWRLVWRVAGSNSSHEFFEACRRFYEESYYWHLKALPDEVDFICSHRQVIDNAETNVESGLDYSHQEAFSTHIQDIAVRNVLRRLGRWFENPDGQLLVIRGEDSNGSRFNPGKVPYVGGDSGIVQPSLSPRWAQTGSVEDFWQSNKFIQVLK